MEQGIERKVIQSIDCHQRGASNVKSQRTEQSRIAKCPGGTLGEKMDYLEVDLILLNSLTSPIRAEQH